MLRVSGALVAVCLLGGCTGERADAPACRQIHDALCDRCADCPGLCTGTTAECRAYYREQCRAGLPMGALNPSADQLSRCTAALRTASCDAIDTSTEVAEIDGCREFLPSSDGGDAGGDSAVDAGPEAPDEAGDGAAE